MMVVDWQLTRLPSGEVDGDLFWFRSVNARNRFARRATLEVSDTDNDKQELYPFGQRVELAVREGSILTIESTETHTVSGGETQTWATIEQAETSTLEQAENSTIQTQEFQRDWAGFVVATEPVEDASADVAEIECYGYDHFLRRVEVIREYTSETLETILEDIITTFTSINWVPENVDLVQNPTISIRFKGERADEAIERVLARSVGEDFGVDNDFEFFAREQDIETSPDAITNADWFDYSFPDDARRTINEVELHYNENSDTNRTTERIIVEDGGLKKDLEAALDAPRPVTVKRTLTRPDIVNDAEAEALARDTLGEQSQIDTGEIQTIGLFDTEPGDILPITIDQKDIDDEFRVAGIEREWGRTRTTVVEDTGDQDDLMVALFDDVSRIDSRPADVEVTATRFLDTAVASTITATATISTRSFGDEQFEPGLHRSEPGLNRADPGIAIDTVASVSATGKTTRETLNAVRDAWTGDPNPTIDAIAIGTGTASASRLDTALESKVEETGATRVSVGDTEYRLEGTFRFSSEQSLAEIGAETSASTGFWGRVVTETIPVPEFQPVGARIAFTVADNPDETGVITATGQTVIRDILAADSPDTPTHIAFGDDGTAAQETDTALGNEIINTTIESFDDTGAGAVDAIGELGTAEAVDETLRELGQTANGTLLSRVTFAEIVKTGSPEEFILRANAATRTENPDP